MIFTKTKNIITLALLLFAGTSFAYGMDEKPPYSPRAQQQEAEAPQAERAALRPARFQVFYGVAIVDEGLLSDTEKRDRFWRGTQIAHGNAMINKLGIQGEQGIEVPYYAAQQHFIGSAQVVVPEKVQDSTVQLSEEERYELDID